MYCKFNLNILYSVITVYDVGVFNTIHGEGVLT